MDTFAQHLLAEYHGCDNALLDDQPRIEALMLRAARAAGATPVAVRLHQFAPQGVSGVVVVEESHLSIHTWPEAGYAAVDFFTCGDCHPRQAYELLRKELGASRSELMTVHRGLPLNGDLRQARAMAVRDHEVEHESLDSDAALRI